MFDRITGVIAKLESSTQSKIRLEKVRLLSVISFRGYANKAIARSHQKTDLYSRPVWSMGWFIICVYQSNIYLPKGLPTSIISSRNPDFRNRALSPRVYEGSCIHATAVKDHS